MPIRDHRTGRTIALETIPGWTRHVDHRAALRGQPGIAGSYAEQHAAKIWTEARNQAATRAAVYRQQAGQHDPAGIIRLEFISRLAGHLLSCDRCHRETATDPTTPESWLLYAIGQQPRLKQILGPVMREQGKRISSRPPEPAQIGPGQPNGPTPVGMGPPDGTEPLSRSEQPTSGTGTQSA